VQTRGVGKDLIEDLITIKGRTGIFLDLAEMDGGTEEVDTTTVVVGDTELEQEKPSGAVS